MATKPALRRAQRYTASYTEEFADDCERWKSDHDDAMRCRDLEDGLGFLNSLLTATLGLLQECRDRFESSDGDYEQEAQDLIAESFRRLLMACLRVRRVIEQVERLGYPVDCAQEFKANVAKIQTYVDSTDSLQAIESRMGYRGIQFASGAAEQLDAMIHGHGDTPKLLVAPQAIPVAN